MKLAYRVNSRSLYLRQKPVRSANYLRFIRKQASVVSGLGPCDAAHTGRHGSGQKSSDLDTIPLTRREHDAFGRDPEGFAALHGLDIPKLILDFNELYRFQELAGGAS